ncbi:MAG: hypothetical protein GXY60_06210 [Spirochaetales bacterium]|nr:hypothetical protein [Spirochaetales bacterium]
MSDFIQYDTSELIVGGVNIAEAIQSDKKLVFNESYTVTGIRTSAPSLYACYDLTVIGDLDVEEIEIRGNLYVLGNIKAKKLSCLKSIICSGDIDAETIYSSEIVANDIACSSISCSGNVVVRTTIDVGEDLQSEKSIMAGEGILGRGHFSAKNAVAVEYFDFEGEVLGKVMELDTDATFGEPHTVPPEEVSFDDASAMLKRKIEEELQKAGEIDEEQLVEVVRKISETDVDLLSDWEKLTADLVDLSYKDRITNLRDYLIVIMATKLLPEEIVGYETLEHVFDNILIDAEKDIDSLPFHAKSVEDFAYALKVVILCSNELRIDKDEALDRIFQSIGIKYKTVRSFIG